MKVFNVFSQVFAIFAFLTLGSLLLIIAFHILSLEHAVIQLRELYASPLRSFQEFLLGLVFIAVGLSFARNLLKKRRQDEAIICQSETGPIIVSVTAMEDVIRKVMKRFLLVKSFRSKVLIQDKDVQIKMRLILWAGAKVQSLLLEVQEEINSRVKKLLGPSNRVEVICDVQQIEDHAHGQAEDQEASNVISA